MCDGRNALPAGTEIVTKNSIHYRIRRVIGGGGSAIVYGVSKDNSLRQLVLKECYPFSKFYTQG